MASKVVEGIPDLEDVTMLVAIYKNGGIMAFSEDVATAILFPDCQSEEPYLTVRCRLDFIVYFAKVLNIPIHFKDLSEHTRDCLKLEE